MCGRFEERLKGREATIPEEAMRVIQVGGPLSAFFRPSELRRGKDRCLLIFL